MLAIVKAAVKAAATAAASAPITMPDQRSSDSSQVQTVGAHDEDRGEDPMAGTGAAVFNTVAGGQRQHGQRSVNPGCASDLGGGLGGVLVGGLGGRSEGDAELRDSTDAVQAQSLQQLAGKMKSQNGVNEGDSSEQDEIELLRLQVLTELVSFPAASCPLSAQVGCSANQALS